MLQPRTFSRLGAPLAGLLVGALLALSCSSGNPVEPPAPTGPSAPGTPVSITVTSSLGSVEAGSSVGATITVTVRPAPADGTQAKVNTSLGNFGVNGSGAAVQLVTLQLFGGTATTIFYGGASTGTAMLLAQVGTSTGSLNLPVVAPAAKPEAGFSFQVGNLSVLFTDTSTGNPTAWSWSFGDGGQSHLENPKHTYSTANTYEVTLSIVAPGGMSTTHQFVTVSPLPAVTASFTDAVTGLMVLFTNTSTGNPTSYLWNFGDCPAAGAACESTQASPSHTYGAAGTYTVTLTVTNAQGVSASTSQFVSVGGVTGKAPQAAFDVSGSGLTAQFADRSTGGPTSWSWNFGDGAQSLQQSPSHTYAAAGTYNVTLTASNSAGSSTASQFVTVPLGTAPTANFTFQATNLTVTFADSSTGNPTAWAWSFGDGTTSTQENPTHLYAAAGTYTATLTASNAAGSSSKSELVTVMAQKPPVAAFSVQTSGLTAVFSDQSTGSPTSWSWNFGDCPSVPSPSCASSQENPSHTYAAPGTYTVTLTVSNAAGSNSISKLVTVAASQAPQARFCYQRDNLIVTFTDTSSGTPTSWSWDFGDCVQQPSECKSSAQNPAHTYLAASSYAVALQVTNANGQGSTSTVVMVSTAMADPAPICP